MNEETQSAFTPPSVEELDQAIADYELTNLFASDKNGALYRARHESLGRDVCIKVLPPVPDDEQQDYFEAFRHEARTMAKLTHPQIVKIYDFGQTEDHMNYFVMEYVEGSIFRRMLDWGQITMDHIFGWITPICEALQYAHERDIVHCDVQPANILVTSEGEIKLANFGMSLLRGQGMAKMDLVSTFAYAAPETYQDIFPIDYRADIYSLGIVLYELLTGQVPAGPYRPVSEHFDVDAGFDEIIMKAVAIDRKDRWQSATDISNGVTRLRTANKVPKFNFEN